VILIMGLSLRIEIRILYALCVGVLLTPALVNACSCYESYFATVPSPGGELPVNSLILLEGVGPWQTKLKDLEHQRIMLVSEHEKVRLRTQKVYDGDARRIAVVLAPTRLLKTGQRYALVVQPRGETQAIPLTAKETPIEWTVVPASSQDPKPQRFEPVLERIDVTGSPMSSGGCGPKVSIGLRLPAAVGETIFVSVANQKGHGPYPLRMIDHVADLNWGACGGSIQLEPGRQYTLKLQGVSRDFSPIKGVMGLIEINVPPFEEQSSPSP
jgi:hypothetical protein